MKKLKKGTIFLIIVDVLIIVGILLVKGPLKNKIIQKNINEKKIIYTLYKDADLKNYSIKNTKIKINNKLEEEPEKIETKTSKINEYDIQILTPDPGNNDYKLMRLEIGGYEAFLVAIYDPTKVHIITKETLGTSAGERVISMCNRYGGSVCINGGTFVDYGYGSGIPMGYVIEGGKIRWSEGDSSVVRGDIIGLTKDGQLKLLSRVTGNEALEQGIVDGLEFGPFLIVDGVPQNVGADSVGGYSGAARVAIAQRKDGIMLFLVTNGYHGRGATMGELVDALVKYGAYNAANLDGGASSTLAINGSLVNYPRNIFGELVSGGRPVVDGFGLINR